MTPPPFEVPDIAPDAGSQKDELLKLQYAAQIEFVKLRLQDNLAEQTEQRNRQLDREDQALATRVARQDAATKQETDLRISIHAAYLEVAKSSLDRATKRAEYLTAVVAAITTLYTALLGAVYGVGAGNTPLPARGIISAVFLGTSLVLASIYMAFLRNRGTNQMLIPMSTTGSVDEVRLRTFLFWTFSGVRQRAWALRSAVVSLGIGVALMPLPFVAAADNRGEIAAGTGLAVLLGWLIGEGVWYATKVKGSLDDPLMPTVED